MEQNILRKYSTEEIKSMNYIFGKTEDNLIFTKAELEMCSKIDLVDRNVVNICKIIWDNRDNEEKLRHFLEQLKVGDTNANNN